MRYIVMTRNIYALLVGIDDYDPNVGKLEGCINDVVAMEEYLKARVKTEGWDLHLKILKDSEATRQAMIDSFSEHLGQANSNDIALFYYAGHGYYEKTPQEFWHIEQDRQHETIVCYDSGKENVPCLADKELGYLIFKVAQKNPDIVVIMDCCHSATGTRDPGVKVRQAQTLPTSERNLDSFIFAQDKAALDQLLNSKKTEDVEWLKAKHVALSACRADQVADEYKPEKRGLFSYCLLKTLRETNGNLAYQDLQRDVNALVNVKSKEGQSPQVEAIDKDDLKKSFLDGAISTRPPYFTLAFNKKKYKKWIIEGGAVHGIPKPDAGGDTLLAIFPTRSTTESLSQLSNKLAVAKVAQVLPQLSTVEITEGLDKLSEDESYLAIVTSLPIEPLKVYIQGEEKGIDLAIQALKTANFGENPSLFVKQVEEANNANYYLIARDSQYWITQRNKRPLIAPVPEKPDQNGYTLEIARNAILHIESIARWNNILGLESPTSQINPTDVEMEIIVVEDKDSSSSKSDIRLEYTYDENYQDEDTGEHWKPAHCQIKLTNRSSKKLYCNVLVLSENYEVSLPFFDEQGSFELMPKKDSEPEPIPRTSEFDIAIPPEYVKQGITEYKDILKLIVSTSEFNASVLKQDGFNPPPSSTRSVGSPGILNSLMEQVNSRQIRRTSGGNYEDWMTKKVMLTYVRPQSTQQIKQGESTTLLDGVVVQPHPSLQAEVNLTTVPQVTRGIKNLVLPAVLTQDTTVSQPFHFTTSRGSDPGLSVLKLTKVQNYESVTPETPLKILVNTTLAENEHILPLAYDGEFYLPLGRAVKTLDGNTEIHLERLPSPPNSSRGLFSSVNIVFRKLATESLGATFDEYPILAIADVGEDGKLIANPENRNQENVRAKVSQSKKILLYIHGIIGDTESLVDSVKTAKIGEKSINDLYDLVLTFDYENLNTTIEKNAHNLRQSLAAVGLEANHGKELHIIAHSMGGLISRWFIEREGGNEIVQHLIMLGTPNAGSPWPKVQDLAFALLGIGLNQLSTVAPPAIVIAKLVEFLEANDNSLEQMQPNCEFMQEIAKNPDPHVPYTIIAGDRSLSYTASQTDIEKQTTVLRDLMQKLFPQAVKNTFNNTVNSTLNMVFFDQPNDIAVTLDSIKSVDSNRSPQPKILPDVACDHLSYFTHPAGLEALAKALEPIS
jgi:pimeloyl-ACP methyl ester carboxylesterase